MELSYTEKVGWSLSKYRWFGVYRTGWTKQLGGRKKRVNAENWISCCSAPYQPLILRSEIEIPLWLWALERVSPGGFRHISTMCLIISFCHLTLSWKRAHYLLPHLCCLNGGSNSFLNRLSLCPHSILGALPLFCRVQVPGRYLSSTAFKFPGATSLLPRSSSRALPLFYRVQVPGFTPLPGRTFREDA